jgi:hypothetical protein
MNVRRAQCAWDVGAPTPIADTMHYLGLRAARIRLLDGSEHVGKLAYLYEVSAKLGGAVHA